MFRINRYKSLIKNARYYSVKKPNKELINYGAGVPILMSIVGISAGGIGYCVYNCWNEDTLTVDHRVAFFTIGFMIGTILI